MNANARTMPKGRPTPARAPKHARTNGSFGGHQPPSGKHALGRLDGVRWCGTSRIVDRPARRRAQRASWRTEQVTARREHLEAKRAEA